MTGGDAWWADAAVCRGAEAAGAERQGGELGKSRVAGTGKGETSQVNRGCRLSSRARILDAASPIPFPQQILSPNLPSSDIAAAPSPLLPFSSSQSTQEEEEPGEDLCNCEFSLAYGAKILLNMAKLRLKKGKRYGLCGPNGAGKSTLMRAIANGQVEGFPPQDELKTIYVEHDIDSEEADTPSLDFVANDPRLGGASKAEVEKMLISVGFSDEYLLKVWISKGCGSRGCGWQEQRGMTAVRHCIRCRDGNSAVLYLGAGIWTPSFLCV